MPIPSLLSSLRHPLPPLPLPPSVASIHTTFESVLAASSAMSTLYAQGEGSAIERDSRHHAVFTYRKVRSHPRPGRPDDLLLDLWERVFTWCRDRKLSHPKASGAKRRRAARERGRGKEGGAKRRGGNTRRKRNDDK
eukprot:8781319-Pyramimonas_sp.AAC.1